MNLKTRLERLENKLPTDNVDIDCLLLVSVDENGNEEQLTGVTLQNGESIHKAPFESECALIERAKELSQEITSNKCVVLYGNYDGRAMYEH